MNALGDLQRGLFRALSAALTTPVYDYVPGDAGYPRVTIGEAWTAQFNERGPRLGYLVEFDIDVWSTQRGMSEANAIAGQIIELLNHRPLAVDGWGEPTVWVMRWQPMRDATNTDVRHVLIQCRCWLQEPLHAAEPEEVPSG